MGIYVHGFKPGPDTDVLAKTQLLWFSLTDACNAAQGDSQIEPPLVVSFLWPACKRLTSFFAAHSKANKACRILASFLCTLRSLGCNTILIAHSLGARVALGALQKNVLWNAENVSSYVSAGAEVPLCDHLFLCAAALHSGALCEGAEFPRSNIDAAMITTFHSAHDTMLRASFGFAQAIRSSNKRKSLRVKNDTMGVHGIAEPIPRECCNVNLSATVKEHNAETWLLSIDVLWELKKVVLECGLRRQCRTCGANIPLRLQGAPMRAHVPWTLDGGGLANPVEWFASSGEDCSGDSDSD